MLKTAQQIADELVAEIVPINRATQLIVREVPNDGTGNWTAWIDLHELQASARVLQVILEKREATPHVDWDGVQDLERPNRRIVTRWISLLD